VDLIRHALKEPMRPRAFPASAGAHTGARQTPATRAAATLLTAQASPKHAAKSVRGSGRKPAKK